MSVKAAFVSQWYPPEPAAIPEGIACAMQDEGLSVEVLTGVPNYPTGVVAAGYSARRRSRETIKGMRVQRTPLYPSHDSNPLRRMANYASWAVSSTVFGQRVLRRADVTLVYSSPATAALPAMVAKSLWGTPYVLLVQDVWPDSIFSTGMMPAGFKSRLLWRVANLFVNRAYSKAAHVAVISPGMVDLLVERGLPREKLSLVHNWLPEDDVNGVEASVDGPSLHELAGIPTDARVFLYAGNHGKAQALETVVDAFCGDVPEKAHLVLMGDGLTKPDLVARAAGVSRVHFLPPVGRAEAARLARTSDVQVVSLAADPLFEVTMPSKLQSALASGHPVLAVAEGDVADVITRASAGAAASPGDPDAVREAVRRLACLDGEELDAMGVRGAAVYENQMSRAVGAARLAAVLTRAARRGRGRTALKEPKQENTPMKEHA